MDDEAENVDGNEGMVRWRALGNEWEGLAVRGQRRWPVSIRRREPTPSHPHPWIGRVGRGGRGTTVYFGSDPLALRDHVGRMALFEMEEAERLIADTRSMFGNPQSGPRR